MPDLICRSRGGRRALTALAIALTAVPASAAAAELPGPPGGVDGRKYELVSTGDDLGNQVQNSQVTRVAPQGGFALFNSTGAWSGSNSANNSQQYYSARTPSGWVRESLMVAYPPNITPPSARSPYDYTAADFANGLIDDGLLDWANDGGGGGTFSIDGTGVPKRLTPPGLTTFVQAGVSADFGHLVISTPDLLDPREQDGTTGRAEGNGLYDVVDGVPTPIALDDGGELLNRCGARIAGGNGGSQFGQSLNPVSDDGSTIFFVTGDSTTTPGCSVETDGAGQIYARVDAQRTVLVSPTRRSAPDAQRLVPTFVGATRDGSRAFFTSPERLTDAETDGVDGTRLYAFDMPSAADPDGELTDLTATTVDGTGAATPGDPAVTRVLAYSNDGSRVYFEATGQLTADGSATGPSIYVSDGDELDYVAEAEVVSGGINQHSDASPDGTGFAFYSATNIAGTGAQSAFNKVYLYDESTDAVVCASCRPDGGEPVASAVPPANINTLSGRLYHSYVTDDGRAFFSVRDGLVLEDANGVVDVYQYSPGVGPRLISSGAGAQDAAFGGASADGTEVAFTTPATLTWDDTDNGSRDLYVARVGGGFLPPADAAACGGDACQGGQTPPSSLSDLGSRGLAGSGNAVPGVRPALSVASLSAAKRSSLARGRTVRIAVRVNRPGRVRAVAKARIGGESRSVAGDSRSAGKAGTVTLRLRLSRAARAQLVKSRGLRVSLTVRFAGLSDQRTLQLNQRRSK